MPCRLLALRSLHAVREEGIKAVISTTYIRSFQWGLICAQDQPLLHLSCRGGII
jgi:2-phosphoglycerate kinase